MTIWKYALPAGRAVMIVMPAGARVLSVMLQDLVPGVSGQREGIPVLYCEVDPYAPKVRRSFSVFGTGDRLSDRGLSDYVGSFQVKTMVYHLYADRAEYPLEKPE